MFSKENHSKNITNIYLFVKACSNPPYKLIELVLLCCNQLDTCLFTFFCVEIPKLPCGISHFLNAESLGDMRSIVKLTSSHSLVCRTDLLTVPWLLSDDRDASQFSSWLRCSQYSVSVPWLLTTGAGAPHLGRAGAGDGYLSGPGRPARAH